MNYFPVPNEVTNKDASKAITYLGSDMRVAYQGERLTGTGSLLTANEKFLDHNTAIRKQERHNKFFVPVLVLVGAFVLLGALKK